MITLYDERFKPPRTSKAFPNAHYREHVLSPSHRAALATLRARPHRHEASVLLIMLEVQDSFVLAELPGATHAVSALAR
jgi:hypothetical protein